MARTSTSFAVLAVLALPLAGYKGYHAIRVAALPGLDAAVLDEAGPLAAQRAAWLRFDEELQCEVLDPCLSTIKVENWEGNPGKIESACNAAHARLESMSVPAELPTAVRRNASLLLDYWSDETAGLAKQADGGSRWLSWTIDTCTSESIPARIDQLYRVVAAGSPPASCAEVRAALDVAAS